MEGALLRLSRLVNEGKKYLVADSEEKVGHRKVKRTGIAENQGERP